MNGGFKLRNIQLFNPVTTESRTVLKLPYIQHFFNPDCSGYSRFIELVFVQVQPPKLTQPSVEFLIQSKKKTFFPYLNMMLSKIFAQYFCVWNPSINLTWDKICYIFTRLLVKRVNLATFYLFECDPQLITSHNISMSFYTKVW